MRKLSDVFHIIGYMGVRDHAYSKTQFFEKKKKISTHKIKELMLCAHSEDSDQTAHRRSLIWGFAVLMKEYCIYK